MRFPLFESGVRSAALLLAAPVFAAQPFTLKNSEVQVLSHSANGRDYVLYVALPDSYATSTTRYPVVYGCDGYWDFPLLAMNVGNAHVDGSVPDCIVVGIAYAGADPDVGTLRQWDLTPGVDPSVDPTGTTSGHAAEFLGVIADQIIPFVESTYRVDPTFRVLTGSSYAGLFTLFALFERPGLFQGYVAPSPSLWWRSGYILTRARAHAATGAMLNARVFTSYATEEFPSIMSSTRAFATEVPTLAIPGLALAAREIVGERHSSTKPESYNRGLRFVCANRALIPPTSQPGFATPGTLINLSTRGRVDQGENVLIGGLVVQGIAPKRLLIRAAGPALAGMGVTAPLANPRFRVVNASHVTVAQNDDWNAAPNPGAITTASVQSGAFLFATGSRDAALITSLAPGAYTIVVESVDGSAGVALVEAYELVP
jgi:predicted alpha/beta superfamily hydrolase